MNSKTSYLGLFLLCGAAALGLLLWFRADRAPRETTAPASPPARGTNVILITLSSLRADHVSGLGYARPTTPHLDRFAGRNVLFRNGFATSGWMMPAHGSLFTSLSPSAHGATHIERQLDSASETLAEILSAHGYYCVGFCCAPRLDTERGFAQGFHVYDDRSVVGLLGAMDPGATQSLDINRQRTNDCINDAALRWLQNNRHAPFFLFVHYYDTHWDYVPPEPYRSLFDPNYSGACNGTGIPREPLYSNPPEERDLRHLVALYDGEIRQTDEDLGQMLAALQDGGLLDNSLVIVLADHGEELYDHGHTSHQGLYDELLRVPLVISTPRGESRQTDALVSQVDILPTILDYLGIPVPPACEGKSLRPIIEGRADSVRDFITAEYTAGAVPDLFATRSLRYKCCLTAAGEVYGYDLRADPQESNPIPRKDFNEPLQRLCENLPRIQGRP